MNKALCCSVVALSFLACFSVAQNSSSNMAGSDSTLPYSPSLDVTSMDKTVDPCVDLYRYSCGGWQKKNPIPPD